MELKRLARIVRKSWILVACFVFLGVAGGALAALLTPVQYSSSTRLFVAVQIESGATTGDLVQGNNFAVQKVLAYVDVATTPRVLNPVIEDLDLEGTAIDLARLVTATTEPNSVIIEIAALGDTPAAATRLARAVSESFAEVVVNQLETTADGSASPVKVEVLQPAVPPEDPALPQVPLNLALGGIIGLVVGLAIAVILGLLDRRLHSRTDVERLTDLPVLGGISADSRMRKRPLVAQDDPRSPTAEAFRTLRTNLQFVGIEGRLRSLVVTSSVAGEGKTTTMANLAIVLAEGGATVALVDADLRAPRLAECMGVEGAVGLTDVLVGRVAVDDVLQPWGPHNVMVLPAGRIPPNPSELLGSRAMEHLVASMASAFDYVLIDAPPVLPVTDAAVLGRLTDGTLLVTAVNLVKENEVLATIAALETVGTTPVGMVLTMLPTRGPDARNYGAVSSYPVQEPEDAQKAAESSEADATSPAPTPSPAPTTQPSTDVSDEPPGEIVSAAKRRR